MKKLVSLLIPAALSIASGCDGRMERTGLVKVTERVYAFIPEGADAEQGLGANCGFVVGRDGVLVVDSRYTPALAGELMGAVRSVTDSPVLYLVDTHYHPENAWGNSVFKDAGALVVSSEPTKRNLARYSGAYLRYYRERKPAAYEMLKGVRIVLPDSTFSGDLTLDLGGVSVLLRSLGPAHTEGDCIVSVPGEGVVFTGGLVSRGYHPNLGDPGGDLDGWMEALSVLEGMDHEYIVPGDGYVCGPEELAAQRGYIIELRNRCIEMMKRGAGVVEAASSIEIQGTRNYLMSNLFPFNVQAVYGHEIPSTVNPDFTFDLHEAFAVKDGYGSREAGMVKWAAESNIGLLELEVHWHPTARSEIILQDIHELLATYIATQGDRDMQMDGSKRIPIGDSEELAAYGKWAFRRESGKRGGGMWEWAMMSRGGKLYTLRLTSAAGGDEDKERMGISNIEKVVSTFRLSRE